MDAHIRKEFPTYLPKTLAHSHFAHTHIPKVEKIERIHRAKNQNRRVPTEKKARKK